MNAEQAVEIVLKSLGLEWVSEYRFHPVRKWRFDYFLPALKVGIEIEGGVFSGGRHTRGTGYSRDCEKYNKAQIDWLRVLRYPAHELRKNPKKLEDDLKKILKGGRYNESCSDYL